MKAWLNADNKTTAIIEVNKDILRHIIGGLAIVVRNSGCDDCQEVINELEPIFEKMN